VGDRGRVGARGKIAAAVALVAAGALLSMGPPRLTLTNAGLSVEYPWSRSLGALGATLGASLLAAAVRRTWGRVAAGALAVLALGVGAHLLAYRVEADAAGFSSRGLAGRRTVAWPAVSRVDARPGALVVVGGDDTRIEVDTTDFRPEQRASLERTIARRLRDTSTAR